MELASYLAGEKWSDHPACTHPTLALMARAINDLTTNAARPRLAVLVPSVIGLNSTDPSWTVRIALRAATTAMPIAADDRQQTLAVAIVGAERMLDDLEGRPAGTLTPRSVEALDAAPRTAAWAREFAGDARIRRARFLRDAAPSIVAVSVQAIAESATFDADQVMHDLLSDTIDECRVWDGSADLPVPSLVPEDWVERVRPAGPTSAA